MGGIIDEHVEWAVVNHLKAMLNERRGADRHLTLALHHTEMSGSEPFWPTCSAIR